MTFNGGEGVGLNAAAVEIQNRSGTYRDGFFLMGLRSPDGGLIPGQVGDLPDGGFGQTSTAPNATCTVGPVPNDPDFTFTCSEVHADAGSTEFCSGTFTAK